MKQIRKRLTYANVMSSIAVFVVLGGGAIAAVQLPKNSVGSKQLKKNAVKTTKIANNAVNGAKIADGSVTGAEVADGAITAAEIADGTVTEAELAAAAVTLAKLAPNSVDSSKLIDGAVQTADLANNAVSNAKLAPDSVDSSKVVDFGLSNEDVGVLFAQVNGNGTLANSSGGVTSSKLGSGIYEVDFGRDITNCASVMTQGEAGIGGAAGAITGVTDRAGNPEATFNTTRDAAGTLIDTAFQQVVVC